MGQTQDFFKAKKEWSLFKDKILDYYLSPYIPKILSTGKPLVIFDCFAGKGKFDDGEDGSPVIIAEHIKSIVHKNISLRGKIKGVFIEKKYIEDLRHNLSGYPYTEVLEGTFEDNVQEILKTGQNNNIFLYIDPYGIKSLHFDTFYQIRDKHFSSVEILMNFNSRGFLREGCRLLQYESIFPDEETSDYEIDDDVNTIEKMDSVAGGSYWRDILQNYYSHSTDIYHAEEQFISEYSNRIKNIFKYTVNIPIKVKTSHLPKYRLIFGSNHQDGLILMADNMNKKWREILAKERDKQGVLFEFEFPDLSLYQGFDVKTDIMNCLPEMKQGILLKSVIVKLIMKYGITFSEKEYIQKIREMENRELLIDRLPPLTEKSKKPVRSYDYDKYQITLRKKT
jgi:three-Cys-motif partner protein